MDGDIDDFCTQYQVNDRTKQLLLDNDVTRLELIMELQEQDLKDIGITLGQIKAIMKGIRIYKETTVTQKLEENEPRAPTSFTLCKGGDPSTSIKLDWVPYSDTSQDSFIVYGAENIIEGLTGNTHEMKDLIPGKTYALSIAAIRGKMKSVAKPSNPSSFTTKPKAPSVFKVSRGTDPSTTLKLDWTPSSGCYQDSYTIYGGENTVTGVAGNTYELKNLIPGKSYMTTIVAIAGEEESVPLQSDPVTFTTTERSFPKVSNTDEGATGPSPNKMLDNINKEWLEQQYRDISTLPKKLNSYTEKMFGTEAKGFLEAASEQQGSLKIIPCKLRVTYEDAESEIKKCVTGEVTHHMKTILLVGQTGTGKSTLVNGIANYIFNVSYEENYRLKLVSMSMHETQNEHIGQHVSQTEWITVYTIPPSTETETGFTLNIVDTPGFADTRGLQRDKRLMEQIRGFFNNTEKHGIDTVNGICFVVKASDGRLTGEQRYVFSEILALFGEDVVHNIFIMATFSDGSTPVVLGSLNSAQINYRELFQFNNSALYSPPEKANKFTKGYWEFGMESYKTFFDHIKRTHPVSLKLSASVLRTREALSAAIDYIQDTIKLGCQKLHALKQLKKILEDHKLDIEDGKNFEMEVIEVYTTTVEVQDDTTNCKVCNRTCCKGCWIAKDNFKYFCWSMNIFGTCSNCKCSWKDHHNGRYIHELKTRKVRKSYEEIKKECMNDPSKKHTFRNSNNLDDILKLEHDTLVKSISKNVRKARKCMEWLQKNALRKDNITNEVYIEVLINDERKNLKDGWKDRIAILDEIKKTNWITSVVLTKDLDDNIDEYFEVIEKPSHEIFQLGIM